MFTRRDFLKSAGQGTVGAGLYLSLPEGAWLTANAAEGTQNDKSSKESRAECDVLVIGGGFAGCVAAIKAREQGANVILVSKGLTGKSGQSPLTWGYMCFNPEWGHKLDVWMNYIDKATEYLDHREWTETVIKESYARYKDLVSWGVEFQKEANGELVKTGQAPGRQGIHYVNSARYNVFSEEKSHTWALRKHAIKIGVKVIDRVMVTELMKQNGRIVGAVGITVDSNDMHTFIAKTTVMCVGACGFKPAGYPMLAQLTCDGEAMAYRAGAEVRGKEFVDTHFTMVDTPAICSRVMVPANLEPRLGRETALLGKPFEDHIVDAEKKDLPNRSTGSSIYKFSYLALEFEADAGHAPMYWRTSVGDKEVVGGAALGMCVRKADGIWPANMNCASSIPGLYAAGDALGTMDNGAVFSSGGSSTAGCAVTGTRAALAAAKEAQEMGRLTVDEKEIARAQQAVRAPGLRKAGYSPRWVTQLLQNTMMPYFISYIKKANRLEGALATVEFMQEHLVPKLLARDPHELRLAHETRNMVLSAEMTLKSALFRTESRGDHYREDYPRRDDSNWLAWTKIREENGKMTLIKVPIPKESRPDPSIPYEERYPYRFPGDEKL